MQDPLIHDDIADGGRERRQTAMWVRHGASHGVSIGDGFLPLVTLSILDAPYADGREAAVVPRARRVRPGDAEATRST